MLLLLPQLLLMMIVTVVQLCRQGSGSFRHSIFCSVCSWCCCVTGGGWFQFIVELQLPTLRASLRKQYKQDRHAAGWCRLKSADLNYKPHIP
jgi:uncharacterized membrane protein